MIRSFTRVLAAALAALAVAPLAVAAPAAAEPALWKASGPNGATVYLFGTIHVLKPGTAWRTPKIDRAFAASRVLWEEIKGLDDPATAQPVFMKYGLDAAHPLSAKLDAASQAKLAAAEAALGVPAAQLEPMRPWLARLILTVGQAKTSGYDAASVDETLTHDAAAAGKPLEAFETIDQQVHFLADLPQETEVQLLLGAVDDVEKGVGELDALSAAWLAGDSDRIGALMTDDMLSKYPAIHKALFVDRNRAMAQRIKTLLEGRDTVFVAVGAAHLAGPDSIQADLAALGVTVVRQ